MPVMILSTARPLALAIGVFRYFENILVALAADGIRSRTN
jgi:hypothetical protein